jgi:4-hydroxy-tetrahydrodipicolinate synthase
LPGIWPTLLTPLDDRLNIAHAKFAAHARALIAAGCGGVTPFGTTGEGPSFGLDERRAAIDALIAGGVSDSGIVDAYRHVIEGTGDGAADARLRIMRYHIPQVAGVGPLA